MGERGAGTVVRKKKKTRHIPNIQERIRGFSRKSGHYILCLGKSSGLIYIQHRSERTRDDRKGEKINNLKKRRFYH